MLKKGVFLLIGLLVLLSGCDASNTTTSSGAGSLVLNFLDNNPPGELREGQSFRVGVEVENGIKRNVPYVLCVSDTPSSSYGGIKGEECIQSVVESAYESVSGEITPIKSDPVYFPEKGAYFYDGLEFGVDSTTIRAEVTYELETFHVGQICLIRDFDANVPEDINCDFAQTISGFEYDGGPVEVNNVKADLSPQGDGKLAVYLDVDFKKSGSGKISYRELGDDSISMELSVGNTKFECIGLEDGLVKLTENNKKVSCNAVIEIGQDTWGYTDVIKIRTRYTHTLAETKSNIPLKKGVEI